MLVLKSLVAFLLMYAPSCFASSSGFSDNSDLLCGFFLGGVALIIVLQAIPAIILFVNILLGLFGLATRIPVKDYTKAH